MAVWREEQLIVPAIRAVPKPNLDMGEEIQKVYEEAADIAAASPRGAAALLRLAIQMLCKKLGEKGTNINEDVASLVKKGLPTDVQKALDVVRVVGNNAVHPGEIAVDEDRETVDALFLLINVVVDRMISQPKQIASLYGTLPTGIRAAIDRRDKRTGS